MASTLVGASGCAPALIAGTTVGAVTVAQERRVGDAFDDATLQVDIEGRLLDADADLFRKVNVDVVESRVLLVGLVPTESKRNEATQIAYQAPHVKEVINELQVAEGSRLSAYPGDLAISTQLRTKLITDADIHQLNYHIETVRGSVYLFGIARSQSELDRSINHARSLRGVQRVVSHVRIK
ncbi:MAG: BON domain-containing protein [Pseudomonadota bacterium]